MPHVDQLHAAHDAWRKGEAALLAGDLPQARQWLEYAHRLAPDDKVVALATATVRLRQHDASALPLFQDAARQTGAREAWLGLAQARRLAGDAAGAADALAQALQRHVLPDGVAPLADLLARDAGAPGWCGIDSAGLLQIGAADAVIAVDGRKLRGRSLPAQWHGAATVAVTRQGVHLLGSPILPPSLLRSEGFVEARAGGLQGWAWLPGNPDAAPVLTVQPASGASFTIIADDSTIPLAGMPPLARPRGFVVPAAMLHGLAGPFAISGPDGRALYGSPLDPGDAVRSAQAAAMLVARRSTGQAAPADPPDYPLPAIPASVAVPRIITPPPAPPLLDVVIPVYRGLEETLACLHSVLATRDGQTRVVVIDDRSPDAALVAALRDLETSGQIVLLRQPHNTGFPGAANAGLRHDPARDVLLLNSDTLVPPGWIARLRKAAYSAPDIGSVTPLSNDATILSYPSPDAENPLPNLAQTETLDRQAWDANGPTLIEIPTGIGFCMYLRRGCLNAVGLLREDVFAQGYGEENDWCLRARALGWRHMGHAGMFVGHVGGRSFGGAKTHLIRRNLRVLETLHPGYEKLIAAFVARDPVAGARRGIDLQRWRAARQAGDSVLLISHARQGGVARHVRERCAALQAEGLRPLVLLPLPGLQDDEWRCEITVADDEAAPRLQFTLPAEMPLLLSLLREETPRFSELHHFIGHHPDIPALHQRLGVPQRIVAHDYALFCPRIALVTGTRQYCGEPDLAGCEACIADHGGELGEDIPVAALLQRSAQWLRAAQDVVTPSQDAAQRLALHFPGLRPRAEAWDNSAFGRQTGPVPPGPATICVPGAIGIEKGYDVLLACARDAARRDLALRFVVTGYTVDDARLLDTGRVTVTGPYRPAEAEALIRAQNAVLGFIPSIWPETWCYTLGELWRAGVPALAFDVGAPAERIRAGGRGWLLKLGTPAAAVNDTLLALCAAAVTRKAS